MSLETELARFDEKLTGLITKFEEYASAFQRYVERTDDRLRLGIERMNQIGIQGTEIINLKEWLKGEVESRQEGDKNLWIWIKVLVGVNFTILVSLVVFFLTKKS